MKSFIFAGPVDVVLLRSAVGRLSDGQGRGFRSRITLRFEPIEGSQSVVSIPVRSKRKTDIDGTVCSIVVVGTDNSLTTSLAILYPVVARFLEHSAEAALLEGRVASFSWTIPFLLQYRVVALSLLLPSLLP